MTTAVLPGAAELDRPTVALRDEPRYRLVRAALFVTGAVLLPLGLLVIGLGWYGVAHTPYLYDQISYLVSGGLLGLGLTFAGGFLYFGAWLARIAADQREHARQLTSTLLVLAESIAAANARTAAHAPETPVDVGGSRQ